jgi:hypothetical protein
MRPRRTARVIVLVAAIVAAAGTLGGCGAGSTQPAGPGEPSPEAEQFLRESLGDSTGVRHTHLRCFRVEGAWTDACTFQRISFRTGSDDPLLVMGLRFEDQRVVVGTGTAPLDIACADDLPCWVSTLCQVSDQCTSGYDAEETGPPLHTPIPTSERCLGAWNAHGGFSQDEVAQEQAMHASLALGRPVYTPHLAGASLGFIGARAQVQETAHGCLVRFDLGDAGAYLVAAEANGEARFWMWQGAKDLERGPVEGDWNACQRDDGTLFFSTSCPATAVTPRPIADELERGYVESLADVGGIPYWLGRSFAGARPAPVLPPPGGAQSAVEYADADGVDLLVLTYRPPNRQRTTRGVIVARAEPETTTVLVVADREVSPDFSDAVRRALRPFISTDPDAEQLPGDLEQEPTRIDSSAPVITHWVGPRFEGFEAAVVANAPKGAGVVRYSKGDVEWFLVSYTPLPKKNCARVGCASPPPLPSALEQYGRVKDTFIQYGEGGPIIVVLTRRPSKVPHAAAVFEALEPLR